MPVFDFARVLQLSVNECIIIQIFPTPINHGELTFKTMGFVYAYLFC